MQLRFQRFTTYLPPEILTLPSPKWGNTKYIVFTAFDLNPRIERDFTLQYLQNYTGFCAVTMCNGQYACTDLSISPFLTSTRKTSSASFDHPRPFPIVMPVIPSSPSSSIVRQNKPTIFKSWPLAQGPQGIFMTCRVILTNPAARRLSSQVRTLLELNPKFTSPALPKANICWTG
jgi:hypothetical protein